MTFKEFLRQPQPYLDAIAAQAEDQRTMHEESAWDEYARVEAEFTARTDCLCESIPPVRCDCAVCPAKAQCEWLCAHDPNK